MRNHVGSGAGSGGVLCSAAELQSPGDSGCRVRRGRPVSLGQVGPFREKTQAPEHSSPLAR